MRRFLVRLIPIVVLLVFAFIMLSGDILKRNLADNDDMPGSIDDIIEAVNNDAWDKANDKLRDLEIAWDKVLSRVQFGSERDRIDKLTTSIARLKGAVKAEDKTGALMELYEVYNHWVELGK